MTLQEIYDKVKEHLLAQGKRSEGDVHGIPDRCRYRLVQGETTLMCAVGCLIKESVYDESLEGQGSTSEEVVDALNCSGICFDKFSGTARLLEALQTVHDKCAPEEWHTELKALAAHFNLIS